MGKFAITLAFAAAFILMFGCIAPQASSGNAQFPAPPTPPAAPVLGGDSDAHGCIGSAGYVWCEETQKCIRPWEENCTAAPAIIGNGSPAIVGNDADLHGCIASAGYSWCPEKEKCLRIWEESCPSLEAAALEEQAKTYCANDTTVYLCGEYIRVVSGMPGAGSTFYTLGNYDPVATCPLVAPDSMSEQCNLLLFGNNCIETQVQCSTPPAAVTDLKDDPSFVGAQLSWSQPDASAADYEIYRGDESLFIVSLIKTTAQTSYDDVFDGGNQTFAYFVRARNAAGLMSDSSNIIYVTQLSTANQPSPGQID